MRVDDIRRRDQTRAEFEAPRDTVAPGRLVPEPPFVWPEPRILEGLCHYDRDLPICDLAGRSRALFGFLSALTSAGVAELQTWFERNADLKMSLIVQVYPASSTQSTDLERLCQLVRDTAPRLNVHVLPLRRVSDRGPNALGFIDADSESVHLALGSDENLGLDNENDHRLNAVFRADSALVEGFRRSFDYWWAKTTDVTSPGAVAIPELVLPEGTAEAAQQWGAYVDRCLSQASVDVATDQNARVDAQTGEVTLVSATAGPIASPTETLGLPKPDALADRVARLYSKGLLVSIDKLTRIPPLDAPLDPRIFGDPSEMQRGNVTRKVSMRVSVIDDKTLKDIDRRRQGLRTLLAKFTFGLADNMRWMPLAARPLFEIELNRLNDEGQKLIADLLKGDVKAFVQGKLEGLVADLNAMHRELGRPGKVTDSVIQQVVQNLVERLTRARGANFMPSLSYSAIGFVGTSRNLVSPWGQALSLLMHVARFPREALTDRFFFNGLKIGEDDLIDAMNVADDALCRDLRARGIKDRCRFELDLLVRIEKAAVDARERCELTTRLLDGNTADEIEAALKQKDPGEKETD